MAKVWLFLFFASMGFGMDIFSIGIRTSFRYEDMEKQCYLPPLANTFVLAAELNGSTIVRAKLKKTMLDGYSKIIELSEEEIADINAHKIDSRLWLKSWKVSGRVLGMLLYGGTDQGFDTCYPYQGIDSIQPDTFTFEFNKGGVEKSYSDSNEAQFAGATKNGGAYRIELLLVQDRI